MTEQSTPQAAATPGVVDAEVGYTDPLLGVAAWPATTSVFGVSSPPDPASLSVTVAAQPGAVVPGPAQTLAELREVARQHVEKYTQAYYQLSQPGVRAFVLTSLVQDGDGRPVESSVHLEPLWRFVAARCLASTAATLLEPVPVVGSIADAVRLHGIGVAEIAAANATQVVTEAMGGDGLVVPAYTPFLAGSTADSIVAAVRADWPKPADGTALLIMPDNGDVLPLRLGAVVITPSTDVRVPEVTAQPLTLAQLAEYNHTTPGLLAQDSREVKGWFPAGFVFEVDGVALSMDDAAATLQGVCDRYAQQGVVTAPADVGTLYADNADLLLLPAVLKTAHYVAVDGDTLGDNQSRHALAALAPLNHDTPDLFDAGALVRLGDFGARQAETGETLRQFADRFGTPLELVLAANGGAPLPSSTTLTVPGTGALPADAASVLNPAPVLAGDTLDLLAARFVAASGGGTPVENLAALNRAMPGLLADKQPIEVVVDGTPYKTETQAGDSLDSVLARLGKPVTLPDLARAVAAQPALLAGGALVVVPPALLPGPAGQGGTAAAAAKHLAGNRLGFAEALCTANAALLGVVASGVKLTVVDGTGHKAEVTTGADDTFNSILSRFAAERVQASIAQVLAQNPAAALLRGGAKVLMPPVDAVCTVALPANPGPFATPVFPLTVTLRLQRPESVVQHEFRSQAHDGPVERADSPVPPPASSQGSGGDSSLTLSAFADAFQATFPTLRLGTAKVAGVVGDVWVVDFTDRGITKVTVQPGVAAPDGKKWPRFFALRPLFHDLVTRTGVRLWELQADGSLKASDRLTDFQGVDVEVWARRLLSDVDTFLTGPYAAAAYANAAARTWLDSVLQAKATLVPGVADGLYSVLDLADPGRAAGLVAAVGAMRQQLAVSLARAYDTTAVVQYDATADTTWTRNPTLPHARLLGVATPTIPPVPPGAVQEPGKPPYTFTAAKTALADSQSFVSFLMRVPDPAQQKTVQVDLDYDFQHLEFDISGVVGVDGYQASDWLAFVTPLTEKLKPSALKDTELGQATVPVPLRAYPDAPVLRGQSARASAGDDSAPPLDRLALWNYGVTYTAQHAAQDDVSVTATFNIPEAPTFKAADVQPDVAVRLAQYVSVADELWAVLAGFLGEHPDDAVLGKATESFATLVGNVAGAWGGHWASVPDCAQKPPMRVAGLAGAPDKVAYTFRAAVQRDEEKIVALDLVAESGDIGPDGHWPQVTVMGQPFKGDDPDGLKRHYTPDGPAPTAGNQVEVQLEWTDLSVRSYQNARAALSVRRNHDLIAGVDTTCWFLYQTAEITAADVVTPFNTWPTEIPVPPTVAPGNFVAQLQYVFDQVLGTGSTTRGLPITLAALYGYQLVEPPDGGEGITVWLPVTLYPSTTLSAATAAEVGDALDRWTREQQIPPDMRGRRWAISLTVMSQMVPAEQAGTKPMLSIDRLVFAIT